MELCNSWPKNASDFKKRFKELPYETCNLMLQLCDKCALGIDFQHGILYLKDEDGLPLLEELIKSKMISPMSTENSYKMILRGKECRRYMVNPYIFPTVENEVN